MSGNGRLPCLAVLFFAVAFFSGIFLMSQISAMPVGAESKGHRAVEKIKGSQTSQSPSQQPDLIQPPNGLHPGDLARFTILTQPGAICTIRYKNPDNVDEGFPQPVYQVANQDGLCAWVWQIPETSPLGNSMILYAVNGQLFMYYSTILQ